jgi:hypothetical protein
MKVFTSKGMADNTLGTKHSLKVELNREEDNY